MSRFLSTAARVGLVVGSVVGSMAMAVAPTVAHAAGPTPPPPPTIAAVLAPYARGFDTDNDDFNIATHLVLQFPDLAVAANRPGNDTVFLPTDYAFRSLVRSLTGVTVVPEAALLKAVQRLGTVKLGAILRYHVIHGARVTYGHLLRTNAFSLPTLQGSTVRIAVVTQPWWSVRLIDRATRQPDAKIINADITASNGLIHVIDRVMLPFEV
jgi:uncharacterized surface protein with fasciclin (FAS1) repeats